MGVEETSDYRVDFESAAGGAWRSESGSRKSVVSEEVGFLVSRF